MQDLNILQQKIQELEKRIELINKGQVSLDFKNIIRSEVVKDVVSEIQKTEDIILTGNPQTIEMPKLFTSVIIIKWNGKEYKIPYYV